MSTKNVHTLDTKNNEKQFIIGIASHENDYRISWALNSTIGLNLVKSENYASFHRRFNETQEFSMYLSPESDTIPLCKLISNRCDNGFLLEDLRNIDYIFIVNYQDSIFDKNAFIQQIKMVPFISLAFEILPGAYKSLNRLV